MQRTLDANATQPANLGHAARVFPSTSNPSTTEGQMT